MGSLFLFFGPKNSDLRIGFIHFRQDAESYEDEIQK